jgi:hypothetical protein
MIKYVKTRFTTFIKGSNKRHTDLTTNDDGEILSTENHTYRLNSNTQFPLAITMQGKAVGF